MKLHFIEAHSAVGPLCKTMGLPNGGSSSYPNAAKLTSIEEEISVDSIGLNKYRELLATHAGKGRALYKGLFRRPLRNESRAGQTDKDAKTQLLVLDIDDIQIADFTAGSKTASDVKAVAEIVIGMLPDDLRDVSYVAVGSSSFGTKDRVVGVHIHMLLDKPVEHRLLKEWLRALNYTREEIYQRLHLLPSKMAIKSIVDPCLAEPSRILYIAPPMFGSTMANPFADNDDRIVLVEKNKHTFDVQPHIDQLSDRMALVLDRKASKLKELQDAVGIKPKVRKTRSFQLAGQTVKAIANPEPVFMQLASFDDQFVRYNLPGGKSGAYWVRRDNPEIVFCFKPDEKPFLFREADPEAYQRHIEQFGGAYEIQKDAETGIQRRIRTEMMIDNCTDQYNVMQYDIDRDEILVVLKKTADTASHFLRARGVDVPEPVPDVYIVNEPPTKKTIFEKEGERYINVFRPSEHLVSPDVHYMVDDDGKSLLTYGQAWMLGFDCPLIYSVVLNMLGDDHECFEHFINWLAFIVQNRDKAKTAWMLHGTQGTGKGLFFHRVIRPLLGEKYTKQTMLEKITGDMFNDWLEGCLFVMIDEFNMNESGKTQAVKTANVLKNMISEPTLPIRGMQKSSVEKRQYLNMIFGTNDYDALALDDKRRLNIAPRQERMLDRRWDSPVEITEDGYVPNNLIDSTYREDEFDAAIDAELVVFAAFLRTFKVSRPKVTRVLSNQAKTDAIEAGMTSTERFFTDLRKGNYAAFSDLLDKPEGGMDVKRLTRIRNAKAVVRRVVDVVNTDVTAMMRVEDLLALYSAYSRDEISDNGFSRMLTNNGIKTKRTRKPLGVDGGLANAVKCVAVDWRHPDPATIERIKRMHLSTDNVASMGQARDAAPLQPSSTAGSW